jgi:type III secretion protein Q
MACTALQRSTPTRPALGLATRRLTRAHVALANRPELDALGRQMVDRAGAGLASALGGPVDLTVRRLDTAPRAKACMARSSAFALLDLTVLGAPAILEVGCELLVALVAELAGADPRPAPVGTLTELELSGAAYLVLAALSEVLRLTEVERLWEPRLLGWTELRDEAEGHLGPEPLLAFQGMVCTGKAAGRVHLFTPARPLCTSIERPLETALPALSDAVLGAQLSAALHVGAALLDRTTAAALAVGDVVVLPGLRLDAGSPVGGARLRAETFVLLGELSPAGFTFQVAELPVPVEEPTMSVANPSDLPVDVEVELTRVRLPLGQLATLRIGAVLPLHIGAGEPVLLRVGDRAVARAELVDVEGELGARVLALLE